jgi:putative Holliday junction resolvase
MAPGTAGRVLGVDFGSRRIGLAISDPTRTIATPAGVRDAPSLEEACAAVEEAAREKEAVEIVVGIPYNMNGSEGEMVQRASAFADRLASRTGLLVHRWDERLTTAQAERSLRGSGMSRKKRDARKDAMAAQIILQSFLDARAGASAPPPPDGETNGAAPN